MDGPAARTSDTGLIADAQPPRLQLPAPGLLARDPAPVERNISSATMGAVRLSELQIMPILSPYLRLPFCGFRTFRWCTPSRVAGKQGCSFGVLGTANLLLVYCCSVDR